MRNVYFVLFVRHVHSVSLYGKFLHAPVIQTNQSRDAHPTADHKVRGFKSQPDTIVLWQDFNLRLSLSSQVLNGYPVGCEI